MVLLAVGHDHSGRLGRLGGWCVRDKPGRCAVKGHDIIRQAFTVNRCTVFYVEYKKDEPLRAAITRALDLFTRAPPHSPYRLEHENVRM